MRDGSPELAVLAGDDDAHRAAAELANRCRRQEGRARPSGGQYRSSLLLVPGDRARGIRVRDDGLGRSAHARAHAGGRAVVLLVVLVVVVFVLDAVARIRRQRAEHEAGDAEHEKQRIRDDRSRCDEPEH